MGDGEQRAKYARRGDKARARTLAPKRLRKDELAARATTEATMAEYEADRPRTRADCWADDRPCPWVSCQHHLYLDVTAAGGLKLNFPGREVWELAETCALDVADRGGIILDEVGLLMNLTRERVRQVEYGALIKSRIAATEDADLDAGDIAPDVAGADYED